MIRYELMNEQHVAQVAALEKRCFADPWSEKSVASELSNPLSLWLVAMDGDTLAGYIGSQTAMDEADMMNVAVAPEFRRQGIGAELILQLETMLKQRLCRQLSLEVRQSNEPAISLYQKLGFVQIGFRPNYYRNPKEAALILRKEWTI